MPETTSSPLPFLWGAATSSHQVEGDNHLNDWWAWELDHQSSDKQSGHACDQWNRWKTDCSLIKDLGHNAHRLSLEWSRIEPEDGYFDQAAIEHYRVFLRTLRTQGIRTIVTLHHFTNPTWLAAQGGWTNSCVVKRYCRYVERVITDLGSEIDIVLTINEPGVYAFMSYQAGSWPPQKRNPWQMIRVLWWMARAHRNAYTIIKRHFPHLPIGIANNVSTFEAAHPKNWRERLAASFYSAWNNLSFYWLTGLKSHDVLGLNYYFHRRLDVSGKIWPSFQSPESSNRSVSDLGWELFPEGLTLAAKLLGRYKKPILVTEHGLADADDSRRPKFIQDSLRHLLAAKKDGLPVIGYLHWSLLDNFEWADGFTPRFGLVEVDYKTQKRIPRASAWVYKQIIERWSGQGF